MDVGTEINQQYRIIEHIGRGGMADVWSARDARLGRMVAIKTIAPTLTTDDMDPVAMFKREAQTIAQMEHPHILPIYDFGDFEGKLYIVMRIVTGGALSDLMVRGRMAIESVLKTAKAIAQALDYAHNSKVIHLDLKPQNILLDGYHSPYLADFGLATRLDVHGQAVNPGSGTLMYMAPEQLTSDMLDKRADVYSFSLMIYHMLTGQLPFGGTAPLAMKQLQFQDDLPNLEEYPAYATEILRRGVAMDLSQRPDSLLEMVEELESVLLDQITLTDDWDDFGPDFSGFGEGVDASNADLLEAIDIYTRAHFAWDGGQGRFLPGVTHFMLMNDYYMQAEEHGLELDLEGRQMMLRGALEYDRDIDFWWQQLDTTNQRWVCLHAVRSQNAPARIRALYRLETLPDPEAGRIPRMVAQALQIENDADAQRAALQVLATRAKLLKPERSYEIKTEYRGVMLSTMTRQGVQIQRDAQWNDKVYTPEIDVLIAQIALEADKAPVRDFAARVVGRLRSKAAVRYLGQQQQAGTHGALRALALVRDEAPNLPPEVPRLGRAYAWLANTWRRMTEHALSLTWRFLWAMFGAAAGMGVQVFTTYRSEAIFNPQRWANTLSFGLFFGLLIGVLTLLSDEIPGRLRGFWSWAARFAVSVSFGLGLATLTWGLVYYMFYQQTQIDWDVLFFGGFGLSLGLILSSMLHLRGWVSFALTALTTFLPIYIHWNYYCLHFFICDANTTPPFSLAPIPLIGLAVGLFTGYVLRLQQGERLRLKLSLSSRLQAVLGTVLGMVVGFALMLSFALIFSTQGPNSITWVGVVGLGTLGILAGLANFFLPPTLRAGYGLGSLLTLGALVFTVGPALQAPAFHPAERFTLLLAYDFGEQLFTAGLPMALLLALGVHAMQLNRDLHRLTAWAMTLLRRSQATALESQTAPPAPLPVINPTAAPADNNDGADDEDGTEIPTNKLPTDALRADAPTTPDARPEAAKDADLDLDTAEVARLHAEDQVDAEAPTGGFIPADEHMTTERINTSAMKPDTSVQPMHDEKTEMDLRSALVHQQDDDLSQDLDTAEVARLHAEDQVDAEAPTGGFIPADEHMTTERINTSAMKPDTSVQPMHDEKTEMDLRSALTRKQPDDEDWDDDEVARLHDEDK